MKSILHLKDDTEYQIPLTEKGNRAKVGTNEENNADVENKADVETAETQLQDDSTVNNETEEISQEEVNNENDSALDNLEDETKNQEPSSTEESSSNTTTESVPQVDSAKAALDKMKKLAEKHF